MKATPHHPAHVSSELHNMSVPPRTSFYSEVQSVAGVFLVFRLQPPPKPLAKNKLNRPIFDCGLEGIPPRDEVETAIHRIPAFLIGVKFTGRAKVHTATTTALSIAILSRRVGEIYVRSRLPDYTAGHLFTQNPFTVEAWEGSL